MKKTHILLSLFLVLLSVGVVALGAVSRSAEKQIKNSTCCCKQKNACPKIKASEDIIPDNLSRQFMSIPSIGY